MNFDIDKEHRLIGAELDWQLQRRIRRKNKATGRFRHEWRTYAYYPKLSQAARAILDDELRIGTKLQTALDLVWRLEEFITKWETKRQ